MIQNILRIKMLKEAFEEWNQKIVSIISTMPIMSSASLNRLCPKYVIEKNVRYRTNFI